jgi:hypothetical protein
MVLIEYNNIVVKQDPMSLLPAELVVEVFSYLNLEALGRICLVSKGWKHLASDPILWKVAIYREIAFGNDKWAWCFGKDALKDEDKKEEFASLPWSEFIADCKKFKNLFPEKKGRECLMLVRLPKTLNGGLTFKSLGELAKKYFPWCHTGYGYAIIAGSWDKPIDKSRWVLMTKDVLPKSKHKSYVEQQKIVGRLAEKSLVGYEVPEMLEAAVCILSHYFDSKIRLFNDNPWTYTRCKDEAMSVRINVGGFSPDGLSISLRPLEDQAVGVAALRKF